MGVILMLIFDCVMYGCYRIADILVCVRVYYMGLICLLMVDRCCIGFIVLWMFDCVLDGFYRVVDMRLCVA